MYVSFGNKKLPKTTLIWNLPRKITCPGKTDFCDKFCYATKAERLYPSVLPSRTQNLKDSVQDNFEFRITGVLWKNNNKFDTVRIHESGDFYNQKYLDKWFLIASVNKSKIFYAYTRSFELDFSQKPDNFVLIASFDITTSEKDKALYQEKKQYFDNTFSIVDKKEIATCIQDCTLCNKCWTEKGQDLTVNVH